MKETMAQPLQNAQTDRRMAELHAYAAEVFGDEEAALRWLDTGLWELDNLSPRETVGRNGEPGLERARDVLLRIEYGVYS
jgi:putative toxin-antitoxin system antitoxin component (TIGR02293 family)